MNSSNSFKLKTPEAQRDEDIIIANYFKNRKQNVLSNNTSLNISSYNIYPLYANIQIKTAPSGNSYSGPFR